jgi:hypothetical protein
MLSFLGNTIPTKTGLIVDVKIGLSPRWKTGNYNPGLLDSNTISSRGVFRQGYTGLCPQQESSSAAVELRKAFLSQPQIILDKY